MYLICFLYFLDLCVPHFLELNVGHLILNDDAMLGNLPGRLRTDGAECVDFTNFETKEIN